jgi:tetratricopeptide (TPR) repeat protein
MKEKILKYLNHDIHKPEGQFFEHEIMRDNLFNLIEKYDVFDTRVKKKPPRFSIKQKFLLAAGVALFIGVSLELNSKYSGNSDTYIFATYYHPYTADYKLSRLSQNNCLTPAIANYNAGNYIGAIKLLREITKADSSNISGYFLLGVSLMETQNFEEAIQKFNYVIDRNDRIREQTEWYLALCYLKTDQRSKAVLLLNDLASQYYYQNKAVDILKKIK